MLVTFLDGGENESRDEDIQIIIGAETGLTHMRDCSIIRAGYSLGGGRHGAVGVIGPKRMNYSQVVAFLTIPVQTVKREDEMDEDVKIEVTNDEETQEVKIETKKKKKPAHSSKDLAAEFNDKYTRLLAEFDNYRKRAERDRLSAYNDGAAGTVLKLLSVVDNFERALSTGNTEDPFYKGVEMIYKQLLAVLEGLGLKEISALNEAFNADLHDAVMHDEDESVGESIVTAEMLKGYMIKDKVLRHSMVKVTN
jgi:molecular chaperone GrpE